MPYKMKGFSLHQGTSPAKAFVSAAQRKAVWASKNEQSPAKQRLSSIKGGEGQDQNKIFDGKGNHIGNYVNGKKVMIPKKSTTTAHGQLNDAQAEFEMDKLLVKKKKTPPPTKQKVAQKPQVKDKGLKNPVSDKNFTGKEKSGTLSEIQAFQKDLKEATTGREKSMIRQDIASARKKANQSNFKPAYEGADYSKEQIAKMTEKEKIAKIDGYTPK